MVAKAELVGLDGSNARIMRTVYYTVCDGDMIDNAGETHPYHDVLVGQYRPKRATKYFARVDPYAHIRIIKTQVFKQLVSMSFADFWLASEASADPQLISEFVLV